MGTTTFPAALTQTASCTPERIEDDIKTQGQALQRVLLRATERDLAAAFHTQALEVPELRAFVRDCFCGGAHPQMLLRLGVPEGEELGTVRRPVEEIIEGT